MYHQIQMVAVKFQYLVFAQEADGGSGETAEGPGSGFLLMLLAFMVFMLMFSGKGAKKRKQKRKQATQTTKQRKQALHKKTPILQKACYTTRKLKHAGVTKINLPKR